MEESAEIHSQALDKALGVQLNRRRRDYMSKGESRSISRKQQRQLTKQTFDGQLGNTHEANLDPLNVGGNCVGWSVCGTLTVGL